MASRNQTPASAPTEDRDPAFGPTRTITHVNVAISALLFMALAYLHTATNSQSALAQAIDSLADVMTALGLLYAMVIAQRPPDHEHVAGHGPAEAIAALVLAVLTGVMGIEVLRSAIEALVVGESPRISAALAATFTFKLVAKAAIHIRCRTCADRGPALAALSIDARNDVLTSLLALLSFLLAARGFPSWDAWLAIPVGLWIIFSGFQLAQENTRLLMGERAAPELHEHFEKLVRSCRGVESSRDLVVRHHGMHFDVTVYIIVDASLPLRRAHEIAEAVRTRLFGEPDVVMVHVLVAVEDTSVGVDD